VLIPLCNSKGSGFDFPSHSQQGYSRADGDFRCKSLHDDGDEDKRGTDGRELIKRRKENGSLAVPNEVELNRGIPFGNEV